ncbi:hypothetical protein [Fusicatenibacter sp.]
MSNYVKPVVSLDEGMAEGVYAASGCYTVTTNIHQKPETGRGDYRIQVNGVHAADHTKEAQTLTITFNQEVTYSSSNGTLVGSNTGTTISIGYTYHQNPNDNIGLGDLVVVSDPGLEVVSAKITD